MFNLNNNIEILKIPGTWYKLSYKIFTRKRQNKPFTSFYCQSKLYVFLIKLKHYAFGLKLAHDVFLAIETYTKY